MKIIIRSNAVETSSQGDSSAMNLYNLYPYYKLALAQTSLLGELSAKIIKTLLNSAKVKLKQQRSFSLYLYCSKLRELIRAWESYVRIC
ncbi:hypothetical protein [Nostoc sp. TCL240-02]|uniref:hypothetical protein n=1 Tax=Nostoc sp. TCL240-02 TaxID=2572090 RepID=UPI00157FAA22|nr:hypothetical protein [Nostoc sp. TCL240-02]QKQ75057.1 hypothetical protein FBB35_18550 [Nostoc sp. TCL240-02]